MTALEFVRGMGAGWNLGNTFDAYRDNEAIPEPDMEICWHGVRTTDELIRAIRDRGFRTIRIPVSWHNHIDPDGSINGVWMDRVRHVTDCAYREGLYVILNSHHDISAALYDLLPEHREKSVGNIARLWSNIAEEFEGYGERLIFEVMNEPRLVGGPYEWNFDANERECLEAMDVLNALSQAALDAIRANGGNNAERYVMVPSYAAKPMAAAHDSFRLPRDSARDKLILSAHAYEPYPFALMPDGETAFTPQGENVINDTLDTVYGAFVKKGIPAVFGEFGCVDRHNEEDRIRCVAFYAAGAAKRGMPCILWDNSYFDSGDEFFGLIDRVKCRWVHGGIADAAVKAYR